MNRRIRSVFPKTSSNGCKRRFGFAPHVEALEQRCVLSSGYLQTNLVSDIPGLAASTDPNLTNPWGISVSTGGPLWLSDNASGVSTLNSGDAQGSNPSESLVVTVPGLAGSLGSPTGTVFYGGAGFNVTEDGASGTSMFLFATEQGTIAGWSPEVDLTHAITAVDNSAVPGVGPIYTGLTTATNAQGTFLLATDFRAGTIDVFDQNFHAVSWQGAFKDPSLPAGFVPFNIQEIDGSVYVTYTKQNGGRYDDGEGPGNGYVDVFDANGHLSHRLVGQGPLDEPWGVAAAPSDFGEFQNDVLIGNFGDGHINAFDPQTGAFQGTVTDAAGLPIEIPGLWGLNVAPNPAGGSPDALFFTAGIGNESHGLFGSLQPASAVSAANPNAAAQSSFLASIENDGEGDNYPLPPSVGPSVRQGAVQVDQLGVTYSQLNGSSLAVVPSLSSNNPASPAPIPTGQAINPIIASLGSLTLSNSPNETASFGTDQTGQPSPVIASAISNFFGGPQRTETGQAAVGSIHRFIGDGDRINAVATNGGLNVGGGLEYPAGSQSTLEKPTSNDYQGEQHHRDEDGRTIAVASIGPSLTLTNSNGGWLLQISQYVLLVLLAGCGVRFMKVKRRLISGATFTTLKSMLTRFARRPSSTLLVNGGQMASAGLQHTEVVAVIPESWERRQSSR